ncbi:unnamed protein product [Auanema sp. JU1783]|nr:unnamed protein product [Auanema sp. JU1783]
MRAFSLARAFSRLAVSGAPAVGRQFQAQLLHTSRTVLSVAPELSQALAREIDAEQQLSQNNLGGTAPATFPGFSITSKNAEVRLSKKHGSEDILVVFNVNHSVDMDEAYEDEVQPEAAPVPVALPPFTVEITKGAERLVFHLELVESLEVQGEFDFRVEEFYVAPAAKDGNEDVADDVYASSGKYIDPDLHDLLFVRYLEERGFDVQFCKNLVEYATHYEHSQYVGLLSKIKSFVGK